jgi:sugar/nucleoside kinase (ribokinase family)/nucleoside 2-deoxyribosyltransferase
MTDLVVIGGIFRESIPGTGGAPVRRVGGSGYVAALTAAALGSDVSLMSFVGKEDSRAALATLNRAGVNTSGVQLLPGASGIFAFEDIADRHAPRPSYRPAESIPAGSPPRDSPTAPVVLAFGFPDFDCLQWIEGALEKGGTFLWDRQGWLSRDIEALALEGLPAARRIYIANLQEMLEATNRSTYLDALNEQPAAGFNTSVIKCGRWGSIVFDRTDVINLIPAFLTEARSVIGSGDTFAGALAARIAAGDELRDAASTGAAAASLVIERPSNIPSQSLRTAVESVRRDRASRFVSPVTLESLSVYLAGPWFSVAESMLVSELERALSNLGLAVVSPRRDIGELGPQSTDKEILEVGHRDFKAIDQCHLMVALLDGDDPGTLIEVGYAANAQIPTIGLASRPDPVAQPMRAAAGVAVVRTVQTLLNEVTAWARVHHGIG